MAILIGKQTLSAEEAIDLFEGGLYEKLQKELVSIEEDIQKNKKASDDLKRIHKRYAEAGVKPLAGYDTNSPEAISEWMDKIIADGGTFDAGTMKKYGK
jgi:hypothetical protein